MVRTNSPQRSHTLYLSLICHWLFLLHLTGKAKHSPWFSDPPTGAPADPPAVILDFMSAVPGSQPQLIQGHPGFYYFILENRSQPVLRHCAMLETDIALICSCNQFASVCRNLLSKCQFLCSHLIEYSSVNFTRYACFSTDLMMPKYPSVIRICVNQIEAKAVWEKSWDRNAWRTISAAVGHDEIK